MILSGQISEGDSERLDEFLRANPDKSEGRLCLNSPGGSFVEGVRLAQMVRSNYYLGTAIAEGHVCESACSITFLAGGSTEGGYSTVRPIMHPRARLGFHAPSIEIPTGQYTEQQVTQAWSVALSAVAEIVRLRSDIQAPYHFPENLFLEMLSTPPDQMFWVDTVEKAYSFDIVVYPVGLQSTSPLHALGNICAVVADGMGVDEGSWVGAYYGGLTTLRTEPDRIEAFFADGFGEEAAVACRVLLDRNPIFYTGYNYFRVELKSGGEDASVHIAFPHFSFDPSTRLEDLPLDFGETWQDFLMSVQTIDHSAVSTLNSCWLTSPTARVTNVNEYVNLRRQPDFAAPVIRQVPFAERVRLIEANTMWIIEAQPGRELCFEACQAVDANPQDTTAAGRAQQCIDDNMLWYEITDARGNRGWVSRKFLEEVD